MKRFLFGLLAFSLILCGTTVHASIHTIDFESDTIGEKSNGFVSNDSALVAFSDSLTPPDGLRIEDFGFQSDGQGLGVFGDDESELILDFAVTVDALSLEFGNDDPFFSNEGDRAVLTVFDGAVQVGQTSVVLNRNDILDQSISFSGVQFNRATFLYDVSTDGLIEIVDNIQFNTVDAVPEPTALLIWSGFAAVLVTGRRRKK